MISIIVPVYRTERVLPALLDSMLAQTWMQWEAVLVIDGSPDRSIDVARAYAASDARFRVIDAPNRGIGAARNLGLDAAKGSLIAFADSDDILQPTALESLIAAMRAGDTEMSTGIGEDFFSGRRRRRMRYWTMQGPHFASAGVYDILDTPSLLEDHVVWAKLFRRELIDRAGVRFPEGVQCEDIHPMLRLQLAAGRIAVVPESVYLHRRHLETVSADYMRARTLRDWISQARATVATAVATDDRTIIEHYVGGHVLDQWWSRAAEITAIERDLAIGVESLAADILAAIGPSPRRLDPLRTAALAFFAAGAPSRRWVLGASTDSGPLTSPDRRNGTRVAVAALEAASQLDTDDAVEARMAAELLVNRVLAPVAFGLARPQDVAARLVESARDQIDRIGSAAFTAVAVVSAPATLPVGEHAASARAVLDRMPLRVARLRRVMLDDHHVLFEGIIAGHESPDPSEAIALVVRGRSSRFTQLVSLDAARGHDGVLHWRATLPVTRRMVGRELTLALRLTRRHRAPAELAVHAQSTPGPLSSVSLRVSFSGSSPVVLRVRRA
nr:glycosyltransferase [Agrococcus sp. KRD186]